MVNTQLFCKCCSLSCSLSIEWSSIRLSGPAYGIVTKTVHKTLPRGGGGQGVGSGKGQGVGSGKG